MWALASDLDTAVPTSYISIGTRFSPISRCPPVAARTRYLYHTHKAPVSEGRQSH